MIVGQKLGKKTFSQVSSFVLYPYLITIFSTLFDAILSEYYHKYQIIFNWYSQDNLELNKLELFAKRAVFPQPQNQFMQIKTLSFQLETTSNLITLSALNCISISIKKRQKETRSETIFPKIQFIFHYVTRNEKNQGKSKGKKHRKTFICFRSKQIQSNQKEIKWKRMNGASRSFVSSF